MSSAPNKERRIPPDQLDVEALSNLIRGMNLAARNLVAYPKGRPLIIDSYQRVEGMFHTIFESRSHLSFHITRNTIAVDAGTPMGKHPLFEGFARALFRHGIIGLTLSRGLTSTELMAFDHIISENRDDVHKQGGILRLLSREKVRHIRTRLVDYGAFQAEDGLAFCETDDEVILLPSIWGRFVKGLFAGVVDPEALGGVPPLDVNPTDLAAILNSIYTGQNEQILEGFDFDVLLSSRESDFGQLVDDEELLAKLIKLLQSLDDALGPAFLQRLLNTLEKSDAAAAHILSVLPTELIVDALGKYASRQLDISPNILDILHKLHEAAGNNSLPGVDELLKNHSREELTEKFKTIFKEDEVDRFVPLEYQRVLHDCITAESLSAPELLRFHRSAQTLTGRAIDVHLVQVVVDIIASLGPDNVSDSIKDGLRHRCTNLIHNGDFHVVLKAIESLTRKQDRLGNGHNEGLGSFLGIFSHKTFIDEALRGHAVGARENRFYIVELVKALGSPFVEPLLDRLAEESDRTLRRFYLDLLVALGGIARDQATERLQDHRWYVVRNIVILLRELNDPAVLPSIHDILDHPHPRVRHELLHILIKFNDPIVERLLLEEIEAPDTGRRLRGISLAGKTRSRVVLEKLVGLLKKRGFKTIDLSIKKASVHALAEMGDPSVLPVLQRILESRSWFARKRSNLLKTEIIKSLQEYPAACVSPTLTALAGSNSPVLANQAASALNSLKEKMA